MRCNVGCGLLWLPLLALLGLALPGSAFAGRINGVTMFGTEAGTGFGMGTVSVPAILTRNVNNDNVDPPADNDNNIVVPVKRFDFNGIIDIQFLVSSTEGVTEYKVFEVVDNNTGIDWSGYKMTLGFGVGDDFVQSADDDDLDFDYIEFDSEPESSIMTVVQTSQDVLEWSGGNHSSGAQSYQFRIDVPDIIGNNRAPSFTLRQEPLASQSPIPEPGSAALVLVGSLLMLAWKARSVPA